MFIGHRCLLLVVTGLTFVESSITDDKNNCTDVRINNGPLITPCVREIILQKGQNFTLTCKGSTKLRFMRQEDSEDEVTSSFRIENKSSSINEGGYNFKRTLDLYFVDQYAIGYYACSDYSVDANIVNNICEEPENNEHVSYIYVYVNGTGSIFAPMKEFLVSKCNQALIECRPTTPDVEVALISKSQNKTRYYSPKIGFVLKECGKYAFKCHGSLDYVNETKHIRFSASGPPPDVKVSNESKYFLKGENFTLNCTVSSTRTNIVELYWTYPEQLSKGTFKFEENTNTGNVIEGILFKSITLFNVTERHEGNYTCVAKNPCHNKSATLEKFMLLDNETYLNMLIRNNMGLTTQKLLSLRIAVEAYPKPNFTLFRNGKEVRTDKGKYSIGAITKQGYVNLLIKPLDIADNVDFTLFASNGFRNTSITFMPQKIATPVVNLGNRKTCIKGMNANFRCDVSGYPLPKISWQFFYDNTSVTMNSKSVNNMSYYTESAILEIPRCSKTGIIKCIATETTNKTKPEIVIAEQKLVVYDMFDGFGIYTESDNKTLWVVQSYMITVECLGSRDEFYNVTWLIDREDSSETVEYPDSNELSLVAELKISNITLNHTGTYTCYGVRFNGTKVQDEVQINVQELQSPVIQDPLDVTEAVPRYKKTYLNCIAEGAPLPQIEWHKDGLFLQNQSNIEITYQNLSLTAVNSTIKIDMQDTTVGKYECIAVSRNINQTKSFTLSLKVEASPSDKSIVHYLIAIAVIILMLIILIVYLTLKIKKEKRFRKELAAAGLLYFKEGVTKSINPDLGIDEQAELLPYDERFEFPSERLILGKQLGAGAFGVVYKAEARGIVNAEETTPVAVKMVKKTADNMFIKALASELKIMVHLGKHINIVNLLGACTKNVGKRELLVIVEYCKYGNIHNYMQRHREVFIDQLDTDNKEKLGKVNRAYTSSSCGSAGVPSDYFGSTNTQDTDHTFLNTANTVRSARKNIPNNNQPMEEVKVSGSEGYVQPEWRSNYESDYSYDGRSPRPLTSRDLLAWAFQIARGMEYLASRKVLHGDLAARNVLLADDNIVKICDFGLAKSIYKNDEYQKKENSPLPVKWLAIECMTDRIFSTQSDVWSFGIVLWELFTLAKTPYPNIPPSSLLQFLSEGHRLDKPSYADERLYDVMKKCWETKPTQRPTFSQLQEILGTFLEDNVRNHYVDLNSTNMDNNAKVAGQEDYLAMMSSPDYNNMVTPTYVNTDKFFPPTPVKVDEEGYLQMSPTKQGIFSPRVPDTTFDFDARKFNPKNSEASTCGSELTPMLTLNNLPARSGSESDHEGSAPYLSACPPIEEADEVFAPSRNDTKNAKNMLQSAVTNPTYITFDNIDEKPKDIINYVNVPNGLVK